MSAPATTLSPGAASPRIVLGQLAMLLPLGILVFAIGIAMGARGEDVKMKPRTITIHSIDVVSYEFPMLTLDVVCGRGTYIRTLARDIGFALGTGGVLAGLRRTAVGPFTIERAAPIDGGVPDPLDGSDLIPIEAFVQDNS